MRTTVGVAAGFMLVALVVVGAWAGEMSGKVQSLDPADRVLMLDDGTKLWLAEGLQIDSIREGSKVKLSYEERDGKNVVTGIEIE